MSKSTELSDCSCFNFCLLLVLLPDRFWLSSSLYWGLQSAPNVSHYPVWKPSYSSDSFLQVHTPVETWYFIFHSGLWMSLQVDAGSHATARRLPLISLTTTNCGWRTNERNIRRFHGNCHYGLSCPGPLLAVKVAGEHLENEPFSLLQLHKDNIGAGEGREGGLPKVLGFKVFSITLKL